MSGVGSPGITGRVGGVWAGPPYELFPALTDISIGSGRSRVRGAARFLLEEAEALCGRHGFVADLPVLGAEVLSLHLHVCRRESVKGGRLVFFVRAGARYRDRREYGSGPGSSWVRSAAAAEVCVSVSRSVLLCDVSCRFCPGCGGAGERGGVGCGHSSRPDLPDDRADVGRRSEVFSAAEREPEPVVDWKPGDRRRHPDRPAPSHDRPCPQPHLGYPTGAWCTPTFTLSLSVPGSAGREGPRRLDLSGQPLVGTTVVLPNPVHLCATCSTESLGLAGPKAAGYGSWWCLQAANPGWAHGGKCGTNSDPLRIWALGTATRRWRSARTGLTACSRSRSRTTRTRSPPASRSSSYRAVSRRRRGGRRVASG